MGKMSELEERVLRLIGLIRKLGKDNQELRDRNTALQKKIDEGIKSLSQAGVKDQLINQLKGELEALKEKQVVARSRVNEMLEHLDRMNLRGE